MTTAWRLRAAASGLTLATALAASAATAAGQRAAAPAPGPQDSVAAAAERARLSRQTFELASELRCPMCQGQSIEESSSPVAAEMKEFIRGKLAEGKTPDEVKDMLVASYGEWVLLEPRPVGFNLIVYVLPVMLLLAGAFVVVALTRRWTRRAPADPAAGRGADRLEEDPDLAAWKS